MKIENYNKVIQYIDNNIYNREKIYNKLFRQFVKDIANNKLTNREINTIFIQLKLINI